MPRGRVRIFSIAAAPFLLVLAGYSLVDRVDDKSWQFFNTGKTIVGSLSDFAGKLRSRDYQGMSNFYAEDFRGKGLGFGSPELISDKDSVLHFRFRAGEAVSTREAALEEWREYLNGFQSIDEVGMHLHRLNSWDDASVWKATVRFEIIGTPVGADHRGIDRGYFEGEFRPQGDGVRLIGMGSSEGERIRSDQVHFSNVAAQAGVEFRNRFYPAFLNEKLAFAMIRYGPGGISAVDYNNDGFYDLFVPDGVESRLFRNTGGGAFEDVTAESGLSGLDGVSVGVFADFDNDGHKDFFVSRTFRPNQLFRNNGDGTFRDVTQASGIEEDCCTTVASWADYDLDGFLDLYVGRYLDPRLYIPTTFYARNGEPNHLYRNNGDGTFTNVTKEAGVGETGLCLGTVFGDYDDDGYPDLYVVNDFGRNTLYRNNGDGTFEDVTVKTNTLAYGAGMNASFGDYDDDGKLDIYVTNIRSEHAWFAEPMTIYRYMLNSFRQGVWRLDMPLYFEIFKQSGFGFTQVFQQMASGNTLLRNKGDGTFEDISWQAKANPIGWYWGASIVDFDNDGWQDIYAADGWVYNDPGTEIELEFLNNVVSKQDVYKTGIFFDPEHFGSTSWHGWERNRMLRNEGDGTFLEVGTATGTDLLLNSRGVAAADFWNRGRMDIAVAACDDLHALLKNVHEDGHNWMQVELIGTESNRDAVGARVSLRAGGKLQTREVILGDGYGSQNSLRLHFGLGEIDTVDELLVKWPKTGNIQVFRDLVPNRIVELREGDQELVEKRYGKASEL